MSNQHERTSERRREWPSTRRFHSHSTHRALVVRATVEGRLWISSPSLLTFLGRKIFRYTIEWDRIAFHPWDPVEDRKCTDCLGLRPIALPEICRHVSGSMSPPRVARK